MALLFFDGFETYGGNSELDKYELGIELQKKWSFATASSGSGYFAIIDGRFGGKALSIYYYRNLYYLSQSDLNTVICGFAIRRGSGPWTANSLMQIRTGNNDTHLYLEVTSSSVKVYIHNSGTADATIAEEDFWGPVSSEFVYIEIKLVIDGSAGSYEIRRDGVTIASNSGLDTDNNSDGSGTKVAFYPNDKQYYIDDFYICDGTGTTNNDFLGDSVITVIYPSSDITTEWGTYGGSTHYELIDDNPSDADSTYIETGSTTTVDLFGFENSSVTGSILGIQICGEFSSTSDVTNLRVVSSSTTSDDVGIDNTTQSPLYITYTRILESDPNTSTSWALSDLNAAQFGVIIGS